MTIKPTTVPPKILSQSILSGDVAFIPNNIEGWSGDDLVAGDFGTHAYGVFMNVTKTVIELFEWDPASLGSGQIDILSRGLPFDGSGVPDPDLALEWTANETFILLGTDTPQFLLTLAALANSNVFTGLNVFNGFAPQTDTDPVAPNDITRKSYVDALVLGTLTTINVLVPGTSGDTITVGNLVYFDDASNLWKRCDADFPATVQNVILGIAQSSATSGNPIASGILPQGVDSHQSGLTDGQTQYASNTPGGISTSPGTTNVVVGISKGTTQLYFKPAFNQQVTYDQLQAMAGTSGTLPSGSNKFVDNADTSGVGAVVRSSLIASFLSSKATFVAGASITAGQPLHLSPYTQTDGGITHDATTSTAYGAVTNQSMSHTVANQLNRLLIVSVYANSVPTTVTYAGVAMTLVDSQVNDNASNTLYVYKLVAPTIGANNVVVTATSISGITATSFYNVSQATNVEVSGKSNGAGATGASTSVSITTLSQGAMLYGIMGIQGMTGTPAAAFTYSSKYSNLVAGSNPANGTNTMFSATSIKINEAQTTATIMGSGLGTGTQHSSYIVLSLAPATAVSLGVVPANSSQATINEPLIDFVGFADSSVSIGASIVATITSVVTGLSGLTPGKKYYLQNSAGTIGTTRGTYGKIIGIALTSTTLLIAPEKTMGAQITKITAYQYTAETDGFLSATAASSSAASIVTDSITVTITGTGTNSSNFMVPVSKGKTYTITATSGSNLLFTPLA